MAAYTPRRGDVVWLTFDPQAGHEQAGRRPAFVVSPEAYNQKTGLFIACPITSRVKGYPFEVPLPSSAKVSGVILSDQIKSLDWKARRAEFASATDEATLDEVVSRLLPVIGAEEG
ncbi:MAG: endoribonuclease MazF [Opitutaceae bacterium]|nr:endoribonuclease MazF [Opitutaceae bacterium]